MGDEISNYDIKFSSGTHSSGLWIVTDTFCIVSHFCR